MGVGSDHVGVGSDAWKWDLGWDPAWFGWDPAWLNRALIAPDCSRLRLIAPAHLAVCQCPMQRRVAGLIRLVD